VIREDGREEWIEWIFDGYYWPHLQQLQLFRVTHTGQLKSKIIGNLLLIWNDSSIASINSKASRLVGQEIRGPLVVAGLEETEGRVDERELRELLEHTV
jgi:hypothetical protein